MIRRKISLKPNALKLLPLALLALAGCSSDLHLPHSRAGRCVGMADNIQTLRTTDELPRVIQVLGVPTRAYRAYNPFGRVYDVLEYQEEDTACFRTMLDAKEGVVQVVFDGKGMYMGIGKVAFSRLQRLTVVRIDPLIIDPISVMTP